MIVWTVAAAVSKTNETPNIWISSDGCGEKRAKIICIFESTFNCSSSASARETKIRENNRDPANQPTSMNGVSVAVHNVHGLHGREYSQFERLETKSRVVSVHLLRSLQCMHFHLLFELEKKAFLLFLPRCFGFKCSKETNHT